MCKPYIYQVTDGMCRLDTVWPSDEVRTACGIFMMFIEFFGPVMVLIVCYGKIVWVLTKRINTDPMKKISAMDNSDNVSDSTTEVKTTNQVTDTAKDNFQLARRNTIKTSLIVACFFFICWSQNQIIYFMYTCGYDMDFNSTYNQLTMLMVFLNCTVNPFIYLIQYRDYQEALKAMFCTNKDVVP